MAASRAPEPPMPSTRKPRDDRWRQQKIPAFRPLITSEVVRTTFFVVGLVGMAMGWIVKSVEKTDVFQKKVQYDGDGADLDACKITEANARRACNVTIRASHKMPHPVYVYYELENFYQNHQRYATSLDYEQLLGHNKKKGDLGSCSPLKKNGSKVLSPCGVVANSLFNDVITLSNPDLTMRENKIAWRSDRKDKFNQPNRFDWATTTQDVSTCVDRECPDALCETAGVRVGCRGYVCRGGDYDDHKCDAGQHAVFYYRGFDYYQFLYQTFPDIVSPIVGVENEHFVVWMRLGGLDHFRKLYGRITDDISEGTELVFHILNNFNVDSFDGKKYLVLSTASSLGANLTALWQAWLGFGVATFGVGLALALNANLGRKRDLGDTSYLIS